MMAVLAGELVDAAGGRQLAARYDGAAPETEHVRTSTPLYVARPLPTALNEPLA